MLLVTLSKAKAAPPAATSVLTTAASQEGSLCEDNNAADDEQAAPSSSSRALRFSGCVVAFVVDGEEALLGGFQVSVRSSCRGHDNDEFVDRGTWSGGGPPTPLAALITLHRGIERSGVTQPALFGGATKGRRPPVSGGCGRTKEESDSAAFTSSCDDAMCDDTVVTKRGETVV